MTPHDWWTDATVLGARGHERTLAACGLVLKISPAPPELAAPEGDRDAAREAAARARAPEVDGVPAWSLLGRAPRAALTHLGLPDTPHLIAARPMLPGDTLSRLGLDGDLTELLSLALHVTLDLRDLHDAGLVHADLQPGNVIVSPDGQVSLIDLPLFATTGGRGEVAGSAAFMAPELWVGGAPTFASDVYALGVLVCWIAGRAAHPLSATSLADWARAHREATPRLPDGLPPSVAGVASRLLDKDPARRPSIQALVDALREHLPSDAEPPSTRLTLGRDPHAALLAELLAQLDTSGASTLALLGPERSGRSRALRMLAGRLELLGRHVALVTPRGVTPRGGVLDAAVPSRTGPWRPALELIDLAARRSGGSVLDVSRRGDRLHVLRALSDALLDALPDDGLVVLVDDLDLHSPDLRAFWRHVCEDALRTRRPLTVLATARDDAHVDLSALTWTLPAPTHEEWVTWRTHTRRVEVRDMGQRTFDDLIARHGHSIGHTLDALGARIGARVDATSAPEHGEAVYRLEDVLALADEGAHAALARAASALWARDEGARTLELLTAWVDAATYLGARDEAHLEQLEATLVGATDDAHVVLFARLLHRLGRHAEGLAVLDAHGEPDDVSARATQARWRARLLLSSGRLDEVGEVARAALDALEAAGGDTHPNASHLRALALAPGALRGRREDVHAIAALAPGATDRLLAARCYAYSAIGLTRLDLHEEAADAHLRALECVESAGHDAELPTYLLNAGTSYHKLGQLGLARAYYARGERMCHASTRASTRALLLNNRAQIDLLLGRLDEARDALSRARVTARDHGLGAIDAHAASLEGEVAMRSGDARHALAIWSSVLEGGPSEPMRAELLLHLADARRALGDLARARADLDAARALIDAHDLAILRDLHGALRGQIKLESGGELDLMAGADLLRRALRDALASGDHRLVLERGPYLHTVLSRQGLTEFADDVVELTRRARVAVGAGLSADLRDAFFAQLPTLSPSPRPPSGVTSMYPPAQSPAPNDELIERFYRMLSLNEVILHTRDSTKLWGSALEIALSLSSAERGFLLLRDASGGEEGFEVVASMGPGGAEIPAPHLEVSLTIASEAARTGRTVVTVDARQDERFNAALSVVDLDLTSVLCVPVRDASGLLGALYLDHRFHPGVFAGQTQRMMEAFGHQLALAITNARRLDTLEIERARLATESARLDATLSERDAELATLERRVAQLTDEVARQRDLEATPRPNFDGIAYASDLMERVLRQAQRVARGDIPVVVRGESGTGKELVARAIHDASPRAAGPFVAFNCGAVTESLFESELFGHVKGAFTGATLDRRGLFQSAEGGTIFLDEVGEMPSAMQVKLLRVLQERTIRRVGSTRAEPIDVRVVCATHRDLDAMVAAGEFREDLYYRLAGFTLELPPLRERREDIPVIAHTLLTALAPRTIGRSLRLTPEAAELLTACPWPGNVRELENALRAACVLCDGDALDARSLAPAIRLRRPTGALPEATARVAPAPAPRRRTRGRRPKATYDDVARAVSATSTYAEAADLLGVSERTLYRYLDKYELRSE